MAKEGTNWSATLNYHLTEAWGKIATQLDRLNDFDRSILGQIVNRLFFKRATLISRAQAISTLTNEITHLWLKKRHEEEEQKYFFLKSLLSKVEKSIQSAWITKAYEQWLDQLRMHLQLTLFFLDLKVAENKNCDEQALNKLHTIILEIVANHEDIFLSQQSYWLSWRYWIGPLAPYRLLDSRIKHLVRSYRQDSLEPKFRLMLHVEMMLQALDFYQKDMESYYNQYNMLLDKEWLREINFACSLLTEMQLKFESKAYDKFRREALQYLRANDRNDWSQLYSALAMKALEVQRDEEDRSAQLPQTPQNSLTFGPRAKQVEEFLEHPVSSLVQRLKKVKLW